MFLKKAPHDVMMCVIRYSVCYSACPKSRVTTALGPHEIFAYLIICGEKNIQYFAFFNIW